MGVKHAKGDWALFLDSDDVLSPVCLELYASEIQKNQSINFLFSKFQYVTEDNLFLEAPQTNKATVIDSEGLLKGFLTRQLTILVPGSLYKVSMLKENNIWHTSIRWSEDQHFMWQVLNNVNGGVFVEACLYNYLQRSASGSIMTSTPVDAMLVAYAKFCDLAQTMKSDTVKKLLVSRWVLGCLNVLAHRKDNQAWQKFFEEAEGREHLKKLCDFPDVKVRLLSRLGKVNKRLMYTVMKLI